MVLYNHCRLSVRPLCFIYLRIGSKDLSDYLHELRHQSDGARFFQKIPVWLNFRGFAQKWLKLRCFRDFLKNGPKWSQIAPWGVQKVVKSGQKWGFSAITLSKMVILTKFLPNINCIISRSLSDFDPFRANFAPCGVQKVPKIRFFGNNSCQKRSNLAEIFTKYYF